MAALRFTVSCSERSQFDHLSQHEVLCFLSGKSVWMKQNALLGEGGGDRQSGGVCDYGNGKGFLTQYSHGELFSRSIVSVTASSTVPFQFCQLPFL